LLSPLSLARFLTIKDNFFVVIHYIKGRVDPRHALEVDAAVKQTRAIKAAAQDWPVQPVLTVI